MPGDSRGGREGLFVVHETWASNRGKSLHARLCVIRTDVNCCPATTNPWKGPFCTSQCEFPVFPDSVSLIEFSLTFSSITLTLYVRVRKN